MTDFFAPAARGVQHASLRAANRRAVLTAISFNSGLSNADLSRLTGLAPQTASAIVAELEADGFVSRGEVLRGRRGQPATPLFLNYEALYSIGCEISWEHIQVTLIDLGSREVARYRRYFSYPDATTIVEEAARAIGQMVDRLTRTQQTRLTGVGLTTPGAIHRWIHLLGAPAEQSALWQKLDLRGALEDATGLPTTWTNNGNAACFGEMTHMPPPRPADYAYILVDTFIAAGVLSGHALWEGPRGNAANLGGIFVCDRDGKRTVGHRISSTLALRRKLAEAGQPVPTGDPAEWPWAEFGPVLEDWLSEAGYGLAQVIYNTAVVSDIDHVVIDGTMPRHILERLIAEITRELDALESFASAALPKVTIGLLGPRAVVIGSAQIPVFRRYFSRDYKDMPL
jgi:predicted NBD/HSP70 family sugar kinase